MFFADLHTHSTYSDGTLTPAEILRLAAEQPDLRAIALTDHNTVAGIRAFMEPETPVERVAGCEFSTSWRRYEIHMLGLFLPESSFARITEHNAQYRVMKEEANRACVERLSRDGYRIDYAKVQALVPGQTPNRVHIARALMESGHIAEIGDAFKSLLREGGRYYERPRMHGALETVRMITDLGGLAVWAHPLLSVPWDECEDFVSESVPMGLVGMETLYTTFSPADSARLAGLCERRHLLCSGGSDFHGANKPDVRLGRGHGSLRVPYSYYEALRAASPVYGK